MERRLSVTLKNLGVWEDFLKHKEDVLKSLEHPNECQESKDFKEAVLRDDPVTDHFAWFDDIVGTIKVLVDKIREESRSSGGSGFDIYDWAEEHNADYYDFHTGYIYHVADYNQAKRFGLPTRGIAVSDCSGNLIGYAQK